MDPQGRHGLEVRLPEQSRMTRDLDLVVRADGEDGNDIRVRLATALDVDLDGDGFVFVVGEPSSLAALQEGEAGWRFGVDVALAERAFGRVQIDVVPRFAEIAATERIALPGMLAFSDLPTVDVEVVERTQHFAEKLHALTRDYGSPNSRVRDLVDM
ncbi:MAG: nucleotidyl transferase AbiEii/AbiGii toxin family protein [Thermoleophilia bacterium]|nr:nucleotidyl transferase AbiEii/AbiGii toxin family protein [Thermoleophilia bacterium]